MRPSRRLRWPRIGAPSVVAMYRLPGKTMKMMFHRGLVRFDAVVAEVVPEAVQSMGSGLNDEGIRALRTMIAPLDLGEDIEQLYRWHDGSAAPDPLRSRIRCGEPTSRCSMKERRSPGFVRWAHHRATCCRLVPRRKSLNCARPHHEAKRPEQSRAAQHMLPAPSPASGSLSTMEPER